MEAKRKDLRTKTRVPARKAFPNNWVFEWQFSFIVVENWNNALEAGAGALLPSIRKKQRFLITTKKKKKNRRDAAAKKEHEKY